MSDITQNTVEIQADVTGPYSPEQLAEQQQTTEQSPQRDLQAPEGQPAPEQQSSASQETQGEQTASEISNTMQEQRSEVQKVLESANIKLDGLEDEYLANDGKLSDESYAALEKAGFSRKVVDTYIAGVETGNGKVTAMQAQEIAEIKAVAGGEEGYATLTEWAKGNLSQGEIDGFNTITATNDPAAIRMAVRGLLAQYHASEGKDPQYITGSGPGSLPQDMFRSWAEVTAAMSDPRYSADEAYRKTVTTKIARSSL